MMILPLADALQNCLQNLTSRIAGVDNEQMTGRVIGMGAMLGFGLGAIKEQFKTPNLNNDGNNENGGGLKGFVSRAKAVVNPSMNLSPETDYNGNINPIRNVVPKDNTNNQVSIPKSNNENKSNISNGNKTSPKNIITNVAKTGFNATRAYLKVGANLAEGNFQNNAYKNSEHRKNNFKTTEYINKVANNRENIKNLGDENEHKGKS